MSCVEGAIRFWKMSGAGNDFIVLPCAPDALAEEPARFVRRVCRRGVSVGADGVLFVTPGAPGGGADVVLAHYNADGGRSDFCGNGTRCAARFAHLMGYAPSVLELRTDVGVLRAEADTDRVRIEVPSPAGAERTRIEAGGAKYDGWFLLAGVPHYVLFVDAPQSVDVARLGKTLRAHPSLGPEGANVDFVGPLKDGRRSIRTFERGVEGETLACGSGAIAAGAVLAAQGAASPVVLRPASGIDLTVEFEAGGAGGPGAAAGSLRPGCFHLTGEARVVFEGMLAPDGHLEGRRA